MIVRDALDSDYEAMRAIYAHHVLDGLGSFEQAAPEPADFAFRMVAIADLGLPCVVADNAGAVVGYAYASAFRPRIGYRYTVEDSVYVAPDQIGKGFGRTLLSEVVDRCTRMNLRQMIAFIGDSGNTASIAVHRGLGFETAGVLHAIGFKQGRWVDVTVMQRTLGAGDAEPPQGHGWSLA